MNTGRLYQVLAAVSFVALVTLNVVYWPLHVRSHPRLTWVSIGLLVLLAVTAAGAIAQWSDRQALRRKALEEGG